MVLKGSIKKELSKLKDQDLVKRAQKHDKDCFIELFKRYEGKVKQLAFRITKSIEDAQDVCQEVFTTVYLKINDFKGKSAFSSWLYRIAFNAALMKLRKDKDKRLNSAIDEVEQSKIQVEQPCEFRTEDCHDYTELREIVLSAIEKLPPQYKQIISLGDLQNLTHDEIAVITGLSISAIKSRLHRARILLKKRVKLALMEASPKLAVYEQIHC